MTSASGCYPSSPGHHKSTEIRTADFTRSSLKLIRLVYRYLNSFETYILVVMANIVQSIVRFGGHTSWYFKQKDFSKFIFITLLNRSLAPRAPSFGLWKMALRNFSTALIFLFLFWSSNAKGRRTKRKRVWIFFQAETAELKAQSIILLFFQQSEFEKSSEPR